jgi:hypothetical protein
MVKFVHFLTQLFYQVCIVAFKVFKFSQMFFIVNHYYTYKNDIFQFYLLYKTMIQYVKSFVFKPNNVSHVSLISNFN